MAIFSISIPLLSLMIVLFIFIIFLGLEILEIVRFYLFFKNKEYRYRNLKINTIGQELLRKTRYSSSIEKRVYSNRNEKKALKILIAIMYINFILGFVFYNTINVVFEYYYWKNGFISQSGNIYNISPFYFICLLIEIFYFSIGLILLLDAKKLGYRILELNSIIQVIFYNLLLVNFILIGGNYHLSFSLFILFDLSIFYLTIKTFKNESILKLYLSPKKHYCHKCGYQMIGNMKYCRKCNTLLSKKGNDLEEVPQQNIIQKSSSNKITSKKEEIVGKTPEPELIDGKKLKVEKNTEKSFLESSEDLTFLKEENNKNLFKKYALKRFVVVSKQIRNEIDNLSLSREAKIDLLKEFAFLTSKEQENLLDLLVHLCND